MLSELYSLAIDTDSPEFATVGGAVIKVATDILNEAPGGDNVEARLAWSRAVILDPSIITAQIFRQVLVDPSVLEAFTTNATPKTSQEIDVEVYDVVKSITDTQNTLARLGFGLEVTPEPEE